MNTANPPLTDKLFNATVIVTALGYLVDMFDFLLFNMVRVTSLTELGLSGDELTRTGLHIVSWQAAGLILGACAWGMLSDKLGRKSCLFGSILVYSIATLCCAFVETPEQYAAARFLAGFGVAGELGVGVTMITERLSSKKRGYGVMIFLACGFIGAALAGLAAEFMYWRDAYILGGVAGLVLLFLRAQLLETGMYEKTAQSDVTRGSLLYIARHQVLLKKYIANIALVLPAVFMVQIIWTLSPEFAAAMGVEGAKGNIVMAVGYASVLLGDAAAIALSEKLQSRKRAVRWFLLISAALLVKYLLWPEKSLYLFYAMNGVLGFTMGLWMLGTTVAAEQFGTNLRATVATTVPNFGRGCILFISPLFLMLKDSFGIVHAALIVGISLILLIVLSLRWLEETHGKNLDFVDR